MSVILSRSIHPFFPRSLWLIQQLPIRHSSRCVVLFHSRLQTGVSVFSVAFVLLYSHKYFWLTFFYFFFNSVYRVSPYPSFPPRSCCLPGVSISSMRLLCCFLCSRFLPFIGHTCFYKEKRTAFAILFISLIYFPFWVPAAASLCGSG